MKILFVGVFPSDRITGPRNSVTLLAKYAPIGYQTRIRNFLNVSDFSYNDSNIAKFKLNDLYWSDAIVFSSYYNIKTFPILLLAIILGKKIIISPRGSFSKFLSNSSFRYFYNKIFSLLLLRFCTIHYLSNGESKNSVFEGITRKFFISSNLIEDIQPIKYDFNDIQLNIGFLGRLDLKHKGLDLLLDYILDNKSFLISNNVKIYINGPDFEGSREVLNSFVKDNYLCNTLFIGDAIVDKKKSFFEFIDLFVLPSRYEGQPQAALEALCHGVPVMASPGSNMLDDVVENSIGYSLNSSIDFKNSINNFLSLSPNDINKFRNRVYNYSVRSFSCDVAKIFYSHIKRI